MAQDFLITINMAEIKFSLTLKPKNNLYMKKLLLLIALVPLMTLTSFGDEQKKSLRSERKATHEKNMTEAKALQARLYEIRDIASSKKLTRDQKNEFRKEVLDIKKELKEKAGIYLYLSMTTIIIILLLIILL